MQSYPMSPSGILNIDVKDVEEAPMEEEFGEYLSTVMRQQNIKKIYIVNGHQFVATVRQGGIQCCCQAFTEFTYCAVDREFIWGFGKQVDIESKEKFPSAGSLV